MIGFYELICRLEEVQAGCVTATLIKVEGSSYLKEGAMMLFWEENQAGMISAGCVEADLKERARTVAAEGIPQYVTYSMREEDDLSWGQGAGCNGVLHVWLEAVDDKLRRQLLYAKSMLEEGKSILHRKEISLLPYLSTVNEFMRVEDMDQHSLFSSGVQFMDHEGMVYTHLYEPKPRVIVFGAGMDGRAVAELAFKTGWSVMVCDWRPALCNQEDYPYPLETFCLESESSELYMVNERDYIIIMSHNFQKDKEFLSRLPADQLRYVGVLGPRERAERLLGTKELPDFFHSPVGLSIGSRGPQEIAVSIVAEMIDVLRKSNLPAEISKR
ncbi:XdhC family protein [Fictibacillus fluitans]|uniref:XdhC family protein n=1 Tax=Fictibacillus fluitans TaxID=3058422 RepID=A0ABT8I0Z1_9BACL|nr:XdhC family protein [Fictibacillus sp. NE201]MDN4526698.1 XdhC family protein [Fictibacillus sp. NE201]